MGAAVHISPNCLTNARQPMGVVREGEAYSIFYIFCFEGCSSPPSDICNNSCSHLRNVQLEAGPEPPD